MDKSLKKLSRVELLELLVALSEEYDDLVDENDRLKQMLMSQRLPRSTKVGSIAEAALQVNGYFEAAQRAADEYLREIKHLRDELAARVEGSERAALDAGIAAARQVEREVQGELKRAQNDLMWTRSELKRVRDELARMQGESDKAQDRAARIVAEANARAEAILAEARRRAEEAGAPADASGRSGAPEPQVGRQGDRAATADGARAGVLRMGRGLGVAAAANPGVVSPSSTAEIFGRARHSRPAAEGGAS